MPFIPGTQKISCIMWLMLSRKGESSQHNLGWKGLSRKIDSGLPKRNSRILTPFLSSTPKHQKRFAWKHWELSSETKYKRTTWQNNPNYNKKAQQFWSAKSTNEQEEMNWFVWSISISKSSSLTSELACTALVDALKSVVNRLKTTWRR